MASRTCIVCGEEIKASALKCRFCSALLCDEDWLRVVREWRTLPSEEYRRRYERLEPPQQRMFLAVESALNSVPVGRYDIRETKDGKLIRLDRETGDVVEVPTLVATPAKPVSLPSSSEAPARPSARDDLIGVQLLGKRVDTNDDMIIFDLHFYVAALDRPARAIKGSLLLNDLFGETKMSIGWTLEKPPQQGKSTRDNTSGFSYNRFMEKHQWVAATAIQDIKPVFRVSSVIFADGSKADY